MARRYRLGAPCPHCRVKLVLGKTARVNAGGHVRCAAQAREASAAAHAGTAVEAPDPARAPEDPRWDGAAACALVAEEDRLWAPCLVAPGRYASRAAALAAAESALQDVRSWRARAR